MTRRALDYSAFESVTVAGTAGGLTAGTIDKATHALITVETGQVRFRLDGTDPTASVGHLLEPGDELLLDSNTQILNANFIRTGGVSAALRCAYGS